MALSNVNKYKQLPIKVGMPNPKELKEGAPVLRYINQGIVQFVKYRGQLYTNNFKSVKNMYSNKNMYIDLKGNDDGGSFTLKEGFKIVWGKIISTSGDLESFSFFDNFKLECFGVFVNPQVEDLRDPMHALNITRNNFQIHRASGFSGDVTVNYLAIGK